MLLHGARANTGSTMKIVRVRIAECRLPLPHVLKLGTTEIRTRDYLALRVTTDADVVGEALGYVRGTPLFSAVEMLAPQILGRDALMRSELIRYLEGINIPGRSALTRALSLLDIAFWDILAKAAQLPLFRLLGGLRRSASATAVAGYYMERRSIADISAEVSRLLDHGYDRVKVMLKGDNSTFDREYLTTVTKAAPGRVAADAHWSWATLTDARRFCRDLDRFGLIFLEDPFAAADWQLAHQLQRELATPIAVGEDVAAARTLRDIAAGIGLLRVDATTCGGISGAIEAVHHAAAAGLNVFPHVFAPLHIHFACAFANVEGVEIIPSDSGADPLDRILLNPPRLENGRVWASEQPGIGIELNWIAIESFAKWKREISLEA